MTHSSFACLAILVLTGLNDEGVVVYIDVVEVLLHGRILHLLPDFLTTVLILSHIGIDFTVLLVPLESKVLLLLFQFAVLNIELDDLVDDHFELFYLYDVRLDALLVIRHFQQELLEILVLLVYLVEMNVGGGAVGGVGLGVEASLAVLEVLVLLVYQEEDAGEHPGLDLADVGRAVLVPQTLLDSPEAPPESRVEIVLDLVVSTSLEQLGHFAPLVAQSSVTLE